MHIQTRRQAKTTQVQITKKQFQFAPKTYQLQKGFPQTHANLLILYKGKHTSMYGMVCTKSVSGIQFSNGCGTLKT